MSRDPRFNPFLGRNPFTDQYVTEELTWYSPQPYDDGDGLTVTLHRDFGRVDDYLNRRFRVGTWDTIPILRLDGQLWMSLSPMEIQSGALAITCASGLCATAGAGLGYVALRMAEQDDVDRVDVYERDPRVVRYVQRHFAGNPALEKVQFLLGDVREALTDQDYDYVFMDIYRGMHDDDTLTDLLHFTTRNSIAEYRFWGQERVLLDAITLGMRPELHWAERMFLCTWQDTPLEGHPEETLECLYRAQVHPSYLHRALDVMEREYTPVPYDNDEDEEDDE